MRKLLGLSVTALFVLALGGCEQQPTPPDASQNQSRSDAAEAPGVHPEIPVVNATATSEHAHDDGDAHHRFELDRTEIAAGWTTFRFENEADVPHFMVLQKLPEEAGDVTREQYIEQVSVRAQEFLDLLFAGKREEAFGVIAGLPDWIGGTTTMGGPGITASGHTSVTTLKLTPGRYVAECYVRSEESNVQHSARGMVEIITVTEESSGAPEPIADMEVVISRENGIEINSSSRMPSGPSGDRGGIRPGKHTIAVHFEQQTSSYPGLSGHDVHLVDLDAGADLDELDSWMYWLRPDGLRAPSPAGATFIGGTQQMPEGETAYVTTVLPADRYALVAEVPAPQRSGMLVTTRIPTARSMGARP